MTEVVSKKMQPSKLAYIEHVGDYSKIPFNDYIGRLFGWVQQKNIQPAGNTQAVYLDDPKKVGPENCRSEVGLPFVGDAQPEGNIKIKDVPAMEVASIEHAGPGNEFRKTYEMLHKWIADQGYESAGPDIEIYHKAPDMVEGKVIIYAEVQAPVRKK